MVIDAHAMFAELWPDPPAAEDDGRTLAVAETSTANAPNRSRAQDAEHMVKTVGNRSAADSVGVASLARSSIGASSRSAEDRTFHRVAYNGDEFLPAGRPTVAVHRAVADTTTMLVA